MRLAKFAAACLLLSTVARADSADPRLAGYRLPAGWKLELAATEPLVVNPVAITFGDDGRLFVIEWQAGRGPNDLVKVLSDVDGDGIFDKSATYLDDVELPAGLAFWDGWTYVTLDHDVVRLRDENGDGKFEKREVVVTGFGNDDSHHRVSGLIFGPDGYLYMTTGDSDAHPRGTDGSKVDVLRSGGVFRCRPDGSKLEVVAYGMRNPFGNVAFDDEFQIFHTDNDNEGSPGFTGCRILHVVSGGDYGWRLLEGARCCRPDFERATWNGGRPGRLGWIVETGRGAPAGLCVLNSAAFPERFRNLLVYPDVFRKTVRAYETVKSGSSYALRREFELLGSDDGLFRPNDAEIGPDGALYILDWRTDSGGAGQLSGNGKYGRIYRLSWGGTKEDPALPTFDRDRFVKLKESIHAVSVEALESKDFGMRLAATRELISRGPKVAPLLLSTLRDRSKSESARLHALSALIAVAPENDKAKLALASAIPSDPASMNSLSMDLFARFLKPSDAALSAFVIGAPAKDPFVARAQAGVLGALGALKRAKPGEPTDFSTLYRRIEQQIGEGRRVEKSARDRLFSMLGQGLNADLVAQALLDRLTTAPASDAFLRTAIHRALEGLGEASLEALEKSIGVDLPKRSAAAVEALSAWRTPDGVNVLLRVAAGPNEIDPEARANLFRALREVVTSVPPDPIADWLERSRGSAASGRVEAIRVLAAMGPRATFPVSRILPKLLGDENADVRRASLALAAVSKSSEVKSELVKLIARRDAPVEDRRLAMAALRGYEDKSLSAMLDALPVDPDQGFRIELLRTLGALDHSAAAKKAESLLRDPSAELRREAIALLGQKPASALVVVNRYNEGGLFPEDLPRVIEAIRPHATPELQEALRKLLTSKLLASPSGPEAQRLREYVGRYGNPERGKSIYLDSKKGGCANCHRLEGTGTPLGPDLTKVWETLTFDKRVESILEPSREIKEGYTTYKVSTTDGRVVTGLLVSDTPDAVTLKDSQGKEIKIPAREVEQKGKDALSLMPIGVVGHISFNELADLLAFLGDRRAQESMRGGKSP